MAMSLCVSSNAVWDRYGRIDSRPSDLHLCLQGFSKDFQRTTFFFVRCRAVLCAQEPYLRMSAASDGFRPELLLRPAINYCPLAAASSQQTETQGHSIGRRGRVKVSKVLPYSYLCDYTLPWRQFPSAPLSLQLRHHGR